MPSRPKHQNLEPLASSSSYEVCQNNYNRRRNQNANISYKAANPRFAEGQWDEVVSKLQVEKPMHRDNFMLRVEFTPFSRFATSLSHRVARQRRSFNFALRAKDINLEIGGGQEYCGLRALRGNDFLYATSQISALKVWFQCLPTYLYIAVFS
jgi:hypothetical protein